MGRDFFRIFQGDHHEAKPHWEGLAPWYHDPFFETGPGL